jgi:diguanylate cyclase (GGDEF)-like protein
MIIAVLLAVITPLAGAQQEQGMSAERFERELERAIELNTTAPWRESQAILDELKPHLELATDAQYAEFAYLEARNQALAGNHEDSLARAEDLLEHNLTPRQQIRTYRLAANVAVLARRFEAAFRYLREGLQLLGNRGHDSYSEGLYGLAAYAYAQVGEVERGLEFAELAMEYARNDDNMRDVCYAEQRFAFLHKIDGNIDDARSRYRNAVANCLEAGDVLSAAVSQSGLADLLRRAGEYDAAEEQFEQALERLEQVDYKSGMAEARLYYARLEHARGRPERVVELLEPVMAQLRTGQTWDYLAEAHRMLGDIARERGDYSGALAHYEARLDAREKHLDMERARRIAFLEVDFNVQHTEQQLALLREQARVNELQNRTRQQQRMLTTVGYVVTGFLVVILILLLRHATRERRRYKDLSHHDGLTGVSNHTRFFEIAGQALARARAADKPFTLVLADIDHFKQVNDNHGHQTGDEVLRRVGARLRECFSQYGSIGRIGGEEFAIALPGMHPNEVYAPLDRLRESLRSLRAEDTQIPVTMSFGVAAPGNPNEAINDIRERADRGLYQAKNAGRDRVVFVDDTG